MSFARDAAPFKTARDQLIQLRREADNLLASADSLDDGGAQTAASDLQQRIDALLAETQVDIRCASGGAQRRSTVADG